MKTHFRNDDKMIFIQIKMNEICKLIKNLLISYSKNKTEKLF